MRWISPLRYPGGKLKLVPLILEILLENGLSGCCYIEPYAGGANVALELLRRDAVREVHINDVSEPVHAFWRAVLEETDALCRMIRDCEVSVKARAVQQEVLDNPNDHSILELGFATFYLNRTSFSGVLRGGVIGGRDQQGPYKIDARFNKVDLIERIQFVASLRDRIRLTNLDAKELLTKVVPSIDEPKFIYLDPPYYVKGRSLYTDYYNHEDHLEIAKLLGEMGDAAWVISYDDVESVREMYAGYRSIEYGLKYNANQRYAGREILFCSPAVEIPEEGAVLDYHTTIMKSKENHEKVVLEKMQIATRLRRSR